MKIFTSQVGDFFKRLGRMKKKDIILGGGVLIGGIMVSLLYVFKSQLAFTDFREKSILQEEVVRIGIVTDIGYCSPHGFDSEEHLNKFLSDMIARSVDFQISLGDNAKHGSGDCSDTGDQDNRFIMEKIRSNGVSSYFALGDHDITSQVESYRYWLESAGVEKTYTSFDVKDVHIIILDTVLGGDPMSPRCEEIESCRKLRVSARSGNLEQKALLSKEEARIRETRFVGARDAGRIGDTQLEWLEADLKNTDKTKVVIFSDHPLFPFQSERKSYNTVNADRVRTLVKESGKQTVFIGGEAHLAHEEVFEGLQFYIIDLLDRRQGSWAIFEWDNTGFHLERVKG